MVDEQIKTALQKELIGRKFRRNKYGVSTWEDTILDVWFQLSMKSDKYEDRVVKKGKMAGKLVSFPAGNTWYEPVIYIQGEEHGFSYKIDECIIDYRTRKEYKKWLEERND